MAPTLSPATLLSGLAAYALATPDVTRYAYVRQLWQVSTGLAPGVVLLLTVLAAGGAGWADAAGGASGGGLRAVVARIVLAVGGGLVSLHVLSWLIELNNLLSRSFMSQASVLAPPPATGLLVSWIGTIVSLVPYAAVLFGVALVYVVRLAELSVLAVLAPLALAMAAHPAGWAVARAWLGEAVAVTCLQTVQAILLATFSAMVRESPGLSALPMTVVTSLALAFLILRLPTWLRRFVHSSLGVGPETVLSVLRALV
jgi:hypothetical protein